MLVRTALFSSLTALFDASHALASFFDCVGDKGKGDHFSICNRRSISPSTSTTTLFSNDRSNIEDKRKFEDFALVVADRPSLWNHVANLRYDEWIEHKFTTSREAFRMATLEICEERCAQGALVVLAIDSQSSKVMGAAEASPIEIQEAKLLKPDETKHDELTDLYITDVITAASHRRKGVARFLVQALETKADCLWLHVASDNLPAQKFYQSMEYERYLPEHENARIDLDKLENITGSNGQILMCKKATGASNNEVVW